MKAGLMVLLLVTGIAWPAFSQAHPDDDLNYTTQRLLIFNERGELALQRNDLGWHIPGQRYDKRLSIRQSLDALADKYGLQIRDIRLAGLFTYTYSYDRGVSSRSHYRAQASGGALTTPPDMLETGWFPVDEAKALIADESQGSPPSFVAMVTQLLDHPGSVWGGAFHVSLKNEKLVSEMTEPFYVLAGTGSGSVP